MLIRVQQTLTLILHKPRLLVAIVVILALVGSITGLWIWQSHRLSQPHPTGDNPKSKILELVPGQTTHATIIKSLGTPTNILEQDGYTVYIYPSSTAYYVPDMLYMQDDVLQMQQLSYTSSQYYYSRDMWMKEQGKPEATLYLPANLAGSRSVLAYPGKGLAAFMLDSDQTIYQVQRFAPTSLENYRKLWNKQALDVQPTPISTRSDSKK